MFDSRNLTFYPRGRFVVVNRGMLSEDSVADVWGVTLKDTLTGHIFSGDMKVDEKSSDWRKQNTFGEPAYDSICFHLVENRDMELINFSRNILTIELSVDAELLAYAEMLPSRCVDYFAALPPIQRTEMLTVLADERIKRKTEEVIELYGEYHQGWQETCYVHFLKSCGIPIGLKSEFEFLARSLSFTIIDTHRNYPPQIIALFLGYAGLLPDISVEVDPYIYELRSMWESFTALNGRPGLNLDLKTSRNDPSSSATLWLVRAATIITNTPDLFERLMTADDLSAVRELFDVELPEYWHTHSDAFGAGLAQNKGRITPAKVDLLIINFLLPVLIARSSFGFDDSFCIRAARFLEEMPAESFAMFRRWISPSWKPASAYDSQALLQLLTCYCKMQRCAECPLFAYKLNCYHKERCSTL